MILTFNSFTFKRYLYTAKIELNNYSDDDVAELIIAADELNLDALCSYLNYYLVKKHQDCINEDLVKLLISICSNKEGSKDSHLEKIFPDSGKLLSWSTKGIKSLEKSILLHILEQDNLFLDEMEI